MAAWSVLRGHILLDHKAQRVPRLAATWTWETHPLVERKARIRFVPLLKELRISSSLNTSSTGKSVIASNIIAFLRSSKRKVAYYLCSYHTPPANITAHILRSICAQIVTMVPGFVPYTFDECVAAGKSPSAANLTDLLSAFLGQLPDVRLVIDGLDEVPASEHKRLIMNLARLTKAEGSSCRILFVSQDIPTIHASLSTAPQVRLGQETQLVNHDLDIVIQARLAEIDEQHGGVLGSQNIAMLRTEILSKSEGTTPTNTK